MAYKPCLLPTNNFIGTIVATSRGGHRALFRSWGVFRPRGSFIVPYTNSSLCSS